MGMDLVYALLIVSFFNFFFFFLQSGAPESMGRTK